MQVADLSGVQKTLLLPLWGRAVESRQPHPMLVDDAAVRIVHELGYDFSTIAARMSPITQMAWVCRCVHTDRTLRGFLARFPNAAVVNLGCGLDTTFERIDNGRVQWFDLDLPDVIGLRRRFVHETDRRRFISSSLLDTRWLGSIDRNGPVFFAALGVFYYIPETDLKALLKAIAGAVSAGELLFDSCSTTGMRIANKRVIEAGGMSAAAKLVWPLDDPRAMACWDKRIALIESYPLFRGMKRGRDLKQRWGMFVSDTLRVMSMVRLGIAAVL